MSERGVFAMHRGWFDHPCFAQEPYTEREAWAWLISEAAWKPVRIRIGSGVVAIGRGQLSHSLRFMAQRWQWQHDRVRRFLQRLEKHDMIATAVVSGQTVVTICNYNKYQRVSLPSPDAIATAPATAVRQQCDKEEDIKDIKEEAAAAALRARASELAEQLHDIFGFDRAFIPPAWLGLGMWLEAGLRGGWKPDIIRLSARKVAARKTPATFRYLEGPIADEHRMAAAPAPVTPATEPQRNLALLATIGGTRAPSNHRPHSNARSFHPCEDPIVAGMARAKATRDAKRRSASAQEPNGLDPSGVHDVA